ncbi:FAD-dependent oxidoreductase [Pleurocapsa sp. PCC 7319]|uniref:FAD-dependent oxidoreductase n=1 Tax=Pleurocapsa sp. PCC 7319 TaxID=118161 RepID=UPI000344C34B|nr:FAD-dependent oxidoreductase [Pleurocapsa sp. PCC 7319]
MNQRLVLIGGGHSHAIALKLWGLNPIPGVELTLISDVEQTPYSGMLPGHVAGFYSYAETHIDLSSLAKFAGAELIIARAIGLDLVHNQVICERQNNDPKHNCNLKTEFDYLSVDIGSTPQTINVPGAQKYAIPAKPVPNFLAAWYQLQQEVRSNPDQSKSIIIVGGGAGGVELALNMQTCLKKIVPDQSEHSLEIHLIHRGKQLLSGHNNWVSNQLTKIINRRGIKLHLQQNVSQVLADRVICQSGLNIKYNHVFWVTQATAPNWIKESQLTTDAQGFILVKDTLQSVSHPQVFAAGDIATMTNYQRPKAGVFAVRQGKPLVDNWQHILTGESLQKYIPQSKYLALIGTGDRQAIASWGPFGWRSALFWRLKDHIDRKFMNRFVDLQHTP